jgi:hypothetical protein
MRFVLYDHLISAVGGIRVSQGAENLFSNALKQDPDPAKLQLQISPPAQPQVQRIVPRPPHAAATTPEATAMFPPVLQDCRSRDTKTITLQLHKFTPHAMVVWSVFQSLIKPRKFQDSSGLVQTFEFSS